MAVAGFGAAELGGTTNGIRECSGQAVRMGVDAHLLSLGAGYHSAGINWYISNLPRHLPKADSAIECSVLRECPSRLAICCWPLFSPKYARRILSRSSMLIITPSPSLGLCKHPYMIAETGSGGPLLNHQSSARWTPSSFEKRQR